LRLTAGTFRLRNVTFRTTPSRLRNLASRRRRASSSSRRFRRRSPTFWSWCGVPTVTRFRSRNRFTATFTGCRWFRRLRFRISFQYIRHRSLRVSGGPSGWSGGIWCTGSSRRAALLLLSTAAVSSLLLLLRRGRLLFRRSPRARRRYRRRRRRRRRCRLLSRGCRRLLESHVSAFPLVAAIMRRRSRKSASVSSSLPSRRRRRRFAAASSSVRASISPR
jgi:hypothetical protein